MIKQLLLITLLIGSLLAHDKRLDDYALTDRWLKDANTNPDSAYNIGRTYQKDIKDYKKAIYWYKKSYAIDKNSGAASNMGLAYKTLKNYKEAIKWYKLAIEGGEATACFNLGYLYEDKLKDYPNGIKYYKKAISMGHKGSAHNLAYLYDEILKDYPNAIKYYEKAFEMGHLRGGFNLAILYRDTLKQPDKAIEWYKKGAKKGDFASTKGAGHFYYNNNDKIRGGAYIISFIDLKLTKAQVLDFLKNDWGLTNQEIKEAYKLQKTLDIPYHYTGDID